MEKEIKLKQALLIFLVQTHAVVPFRPSLGLCKPQPTCCYYTSGPDRCLADLEVC